MVFMPLPLPDFIADKELLYHYIPMNPNLWKSNENRPSSAAFKDSKGVSVDRDGDREEVMIIEWYKSRFDSIRAIIRISAGKCRELETYPIARQLENNPYHAEIHDSNNRVSMKGSKPKKLATNCEIVQTY